MKLVLLLLMSLLAAEAFFLPITIRIIVPKVIKPFRLGIPLTALFTFKAVQFAKLAFLTSLFRRKRDLRGPVGGGHRILTMSHEEAEQHIERLFVILQSNDPDDCFKRTICHLEARKQSQPLTSVEEFFVGLFGEEPQIPKPSHSRKASFPFQYAAFIGHMSRNPKTCKDGYTRCQVEPESLLRMYAQRGKPRLKVDGNTAAVTLEGQQSLPPSPYVPPPSPLEQDSNSVYGGSPYSGSHLPPTVTPATTTKATSGYDMLKDVLKDVFLGHVPGFGRKTSNGYASRPRKGPIRGDEDSHDGRAYLMIRFNGR